MINDDLSDVWSEIRRMQAELQELRTTPSLESASITRGGLRVASDEGLSVEGSAIVSGLLRVTGTELVNGTLRVTGNFELSGPATISGETTISGNTTISGAVDVTGDLTATGDTDLNGPTTIDGTLTVNGDTTLAGTTAITGNTSVAGNLTATGDTDLGGTLHITGEAHLDNDLDVAAGKKITLGGLTLENLGSDGGAVNFPEGNLSVSAITGMQLLHPDVIDINSARVDIQGVGLYIRNLPTISGVTANLYVDPDTDEAGIAES